MQATLRVPIGPQPSTTFSTLRPKREVICSRSYGWGGGEGVQPQNWNSESVLVTLFPGGGQ